VQFHCGKPPPAAEPNTMIRMSENRSFYSNANISGTPVISDVPEIIKIKFQLKRSW
jgi:hypothetical protein